MEGLDPSEEDEDALGCHQGEDESIHCTAVLTNHIHLYLMDMHGIPQASMAGKGQTNKLSFVEGLSSHMVALICLV